MNDHLDPTTPDDDDDDLALSAAGARLREQSSSLSPATVEVGALRRRIRRMSVVAGTSLVAVALLAGLLIQQRSATPGSEMASNQRGTATPAKVGRLLSSLDPQPIDPTKVELVSTVSTFPDCDALIGDLRRVGAEHVGSRGFGGFWGVIPFGYSESALGGFAADGAASAAPQPASRALGGGGADGSTLGTNVQVEGVDELDYVKAVGSLIYDLDGKGNLRITDAKALEVISTLDVTPPEADADGGGPGVYGPGGPAQTGDLLVADGRVVVFGTEVEVSDPVEGDPSATQATTVFMTVTFVDATDPASPTITDQVRVEGSLVSARLVDGEVRLVTTSNMADLGFVSPTTPSSVANALDLNRRTVAASTAPDWVPDWQRDGEDPVPLVPCDRVHVPDTFSGVAMTSMVTFPLGAGRFEPAGTSILAPASTLYAGLDKVAISSEVWVDPIDRDRLHFDRWQTAVHEFHFDDDAAPSYAGSGIVDGSTIGQFAFGELAGSLAVVTTEGVPWQQDPTNGIDLTILTPDGDGALTETSKVADLADGKGEVSAVRFVDDRVLISTGPFGREIHVIDVTQPTDPRRAGSLTLASTVGYFHPLPDHQALVVGSRYDEVGEGRNQQTRSWVQAQLLDISDPDAPRIVSTWERPWVADNVASDHHAFTYWPDRQLAMWGLANTQFDPQDRSNQAAVLSTSGGITEVAAPVASKPNEVASPCPTVEITEAEARQMVGPGGRVLRCGDRELTEVEWPRYQCYRVDDATIARFAPGEQEAASFFVCSPAPPPTVNRVLVVSGTPIMVTDQTLEALDPTTFQTSSVAFHPTEGWFGGF